MKKRILSVLITLVMLIGLVSVMSISASAAAGYLRNGFLCSGTVNSDEIRPGDILSPGTKICAHTSGIEINIRQEPSGGAVTGYRLSRNDTWPKSSSEYYNRAFYVDYANTSNWIYLIPIETADIIFDYNDGTGSSITKSWYTKVPMQHELALYQASAPEVTRTGYTFVGWNTKADGTGTEFISTSSEDFSVTGDTTLYAQWTANNYTVNFEANGGSVSTTSKTVTYDSAYGTLPTPTRTGYIFAGWYTDSVNGNKVESSTTVTITDTQTLYAHWTLNTYGVTLNTNGGTINSGNVTSFTYGTGATLPTDVTKTGYTFGGWYENSDFSGSAVTSISTTAMGAKTYYAKWTPNTYTVNFNANGGEVATTSTSVIFDTTYGTLPTPTRTGYTFMGWHTDSVNGNKVESSTTVTITDTQTLYAHWEKIVYNVTLGESLHGDVNIPTANATMDDTVDVIITPNEGYEVDTVTFNGVAATKVSEDNYTFTMPAADAVVAVTYKKIPYTVTLINDGTAAGGSFSVDMSTATIGDTVTITVNPNLGYFIEAVTFNGAAATNNGDGTYSFTMPAQNVSVSVAFDVDLPAIAKELQLLNDADAALQTAISSGDNDLTAEISALSTAITNAQNTIDNLDNGYATDAQLDELKSALEAAENTMTTAINALKDRVTEIENRLNGIDLSQIATNKQEIADLTTELDAVKDTVDQLDNTFINNTELSDALGNLKAELDEADALLEKAIQDVQDNLDAAKKELTDAIDALDEAMKKGDSDLAEEINNLNEALINAENALKQADETNKAELTEKIDEADALLEKAIQDVQDNLDAAKKELADAITALDEAMKKGDSDLAEEINDLNEALINAENALKQADETNKAELTEKIDEADALLEKAIQDVQDNLNAAKKELTDAITALDEAMKKGDSDLAEEIKGLNEALINAENALKQADETNKAELTKKIDKADALLEKAIQDVQDNLDAAKKELADAITALDEAMKKGDADLSDKIAALAKALAKAQEELENTIADNKAALEAKIVIANTVIKGAVNQVQKNLDTAKNQLETAISDGDTALSGKIAELNDALTSAQSALTAVDEANKAELISKIDAADATLDAAIKAVQKNLDDAKAELNKAIANGDTALDDKISALNEALATAKAALEATDSANKSELITKIDEADSTLKAAIDSLSNELNATNEKVAKLETFIIIVCVISGVAFCGCGTLAVFYIIDKKKKI